MSDARSPKIVIFVEPAEAAMMGKDDDERPGPRLCKGGATIDGVYYYMPAESSIVVGCHDSGPMEVTMTFLAHDVQFVERPPE